MQENAAIAAVAQDQFGDLYVMDASNRIVVHYPSILAVNAASKLFQGLCQSMRVSALSILAA